MHELFLQMPWLWLVPHARQVMGDDWEQTGAGMAVFIARLPKILRKMVGAEEALPRIVFSDRGPGFYQGSTGSIVNAYCTALREHKFRAFAGENALWQPADMPDLFMHETVAASYVFTTVFV